MDNSPDAVNASFQNAAGLPIADASDPGPPQLPLQIVEGPAQVVPASPEDEEAENSRTDVVASVFMVVEARPAQQYRSSGFSADRIPNGWPFMETSEPSGGTIGLGDTAMVVGPRHVNTLTKRPGLLEMPGTSKRARERGPQV